MCVGVFPEQLHTDVQTVGSLLYIIYIPNALIDGYTAKGVDVSDVFI